jgi:hypothetical protein
MNVRSQAASRGRATAIGITMLVVAFIGADGRTSARAQGGRAVNQRPPQAPGTPGNANLRGRHGPDPIKDPTAGERAEVAGRVYRAVLDEWVQRPTTTAGSGGAPPEVEDRSRIEIAERLGPWSLSWQEAQDNAARSMAARYQSLSDHLGRMSALEDGRFGRGTARAAGGPVASEPPRLRAEVARFFRPIDGWEIDRIIPASLESERPLNPLGVAVTPAERVEIAGRIYRAILDDAADRLLATARDGEARREEGPILDALLAERLGFWSELWRQSQDVAARAPSSRSAGVGYAGPGGRAAVRAHIERMSRLEDGRFAIDALKRPGLPAAPPVDMTRFREFTEVARFFRIESEDRLQGASRPKGAGVTDSGQAETAGRIYGAILDGAARRYREVPRTSGGSADVRLVFDPRLAERLAAWSIRWARARIRLDQGRVSQFNAVRSHVERMAALEDGRSLREALERAGPLAVGLAAPSPPGEFADVARFFRLEALWELEQIRAR